MSRLRIAALVVALALVAMACGGDDNAGDDTTTTTTAAETTTTAPGATTTAASATPDDGVVDVGDTIAVHYVGTLDDGSQFDSSRERGEPLEFTVGSGQVIPGFDDAVLGLAVGDVNTVTISPDQAYGQVDPEAVIEFPIEEVPEEFRVVGSQVLLGNSLPATVIEVTEDTVTIDANHPLAGQALTFEIEIVEIL